MPMGISLFWCPICRSYLVRNFRRANGLALQQRDFIKIKFDEHAYLNPECPVFVPMSSFCGWSPAHFKPVRIAGFEGPCGVLHRRALGQHVFGQVVQPGADRADFL